MLAKRFPSIFLPLLLFQVALSGCGYMIRGRSHNSLAQEGIRKVYITPVVNNTYRYGVENVVYNNLVRSLAAYGGVKQVSDPSQADAVLSGTVTQAESQIGGTLPANALNPRNLPIPTSFGSLFVANDYNAVLSCNFNLIWREVPQGKNAIVWTGSFSRSKPYPGSNQLGILGTTSGLINDSEFDRTILDIAASMMVDVREAMMDRF